MYPMCSFTYLRESKHSIPAGGLADTQDAQQICSDQHEILISEHGTVNLSSHTLGIDR